MKNKGRIIVISVCEILMAVFMLILTFIKFDTWNGKQIFIAAFGALVCIGIAFEGRKIMPKITDEKFFDAFFLLFIFFNMTHLAREIEKADSVFLNFCIPIAFLIISVYYLVKVIRHKNES